MRDKLLLILALNVSLGLLYKYESQIHLNTHARYISNNLISNLEGSSFKEWKSTGCTQVLKQWQQIKCLPNQHLNYLLIIIYYLCYQQIL